jgi:hypothetical protein
MNRRAAIEIQFNWIFVLLVGATILIFFAGIITKQKELSSTRVSTVVLNDLETITVGAKVTKGTVQIIRTPDIEIKFDCKDCSCAFYIGSGSKPYGDKLMFTPSSIKGRNVLTWTLDWGVPYRITNLLYLTSPYLRYVVIGNNALALEINSTLPEELYKHYYASSPPTGTILDENNYKVRFVYVDVNPSNDDLTNLENMKDTDVTAVRIDSAAETVDFYRKIRDVWSPSLGQSYYVEKESIYAAIFSENLDIYNCKMKDAFKRMNYVTQIYLGRTNFLRDNSGPSCPSALYTNASLVTLSTESETLADTFPADTTNIKNAAYILEQQNSQAQLYSCPEIY